MDSTLKSPEIFAHLHELHIAFIEKCASPRPAASAIIADSGITTQSGSFPGSACFLRESGVLAIEEFRSRTAGDTNFVVVNNDPYLGGISLAHLAVQAPILIDGRVVGVFSVGVHHADVGEMRAAARSTMREVTHEGMRVSNLLLSHGGGRVEEWFENMLVANVRERSVGPRIFHEQCRSAIEGSRRFSSLFASVAARPGAATPDRISDLVSMVAPRHAPFTLNVGNVERKALLTVSNEPHKLRIHLSGDLGPSKDGENSPLSLSRSACAEAIAEKTHLPAWAIAEHIDLSVGRGTIFHPIYPYGVAGGGRIADQLRVAVGECMQG